MDSQIRCPHLALSGLLGAVEAQADLLLGQHHRHHGLLSWVDPKLGRTTCRERCWPASANLLQLAQVSSHADETRTS